MSKEQIFHAIKDLPFNKMGVVEGLHIPMVMASMAWLEASMKDYRPEVTLCSHLSTINYDDYKIYLFLRPK